MYHRRKDYLLTMIEELGKLISKLFSKAEDVSMKRDSLEKGFSFYSDNFGITGGTDVDEILEKLPTFYFIEEYAKLLFYKYQLLDVKYEGDLHKALSLIIFLNKADNSYSWDRMLLREDILKELDNLKN